MQNLFEAFDYRVMFNDVMKFAQNIGDEEKIDYCKRKIDSEIQWAERVLKNRDRITWYLRYIKAQLLDLTDLDENGRVKMGMVSKRGRLYIQKFDHGAANAFNFERDGRSYNTFGVSTSVSEELAHFMSLDSGNIQNYLFGTKPNVEVFNDLEAIEKAWIESGGQRRIRADHPNNEHAIVLIEYGKMAWYDLQRPSCSAEGAAMRHCGNSPRSNTEDTILSLRSTGDKDGKRYVEPHLTFTMDSDNYLQERKARGNSRPPAQYHPMIVDLLLLKGEDTSFRDGYAGHPGEWFVEGLGDGHWQQEDDFQVADLNEEQKERLLTQRPELGDAFGYATYAPEVDWDVFRSKLRRNWLMSIYPTDNGNFAIRTTLPGWLNFMVCRDGCAPMLEEDALKGDPRSQMTREEQRPYLNMIAKRSKMFRLSGLKMLAPLVQELQKRFRVEFKEHGHSGKQNAMSLYIHGSYEALADCFKMQDGAYWAMHKLNDRAFDKQVSAKAEEEYNKAVTAINAAAINYLLHRPEEPRY